jgi:alkylation response protein AidB-like acyl-CoA dehydrogenase
MFKLSEECIDIRKSARQFAREEIAPVAAEYDESKEYPWDVVQKAADRGLVAPHIPEEYGGAGMDTLETCLVYEEFNRADVGIGTVLMSAGFGTNMLLKYGDQWMKDEILPRVAAGKAVTGTAISEPKHGSDVASIETHAERDGDEWIINGEKKWIGNGTVADHVVVMAKTDENGGSKGISAFLVPTKVDGYEPKQIDNKLGLHAIDNARIVFSDVRVPAQNLIGKENKGFYQLMEFLANSRTLTAAQAVGGGQGALDAAIEYAEQREQFGKSISEFQAIRHKLAEIATNIEAARSLTYRAADYVETDSELATRLASMAKLFASDHAVNASDEALQVHGGAGYVKDYPAERFYRDVRITKIYEGTNEIQKNIIAKQLF